jgi:hypothetical protein
MPEYATAITSYLRDLQRVVAGLDVGEVETVVGVLKRTYDEERDLRPRQRRQRLDRITFGVRSQQSGVPPRAKKGVPRHGAHG